MSTLLVESPAVAIVPTGQAGLSGLVVSGAELAAVGPADCQAAETSVSVAVAELAAVGTGGKAPEFSFSDDELAAVIVSDASLLYGTDATKTLLNLGRKVTIYANRGTNKAARSKRAEEVAKAAAPTSTDIASRIRLAICVYHVSLRVPRLAELAIRDLEAVIQAAHIGVDWRYVTDNAAADTYNKLAAVVDALLSRQLGNREGKMVKPHPSEWRAAVRAVIREGKTVAEMIQAAEQSKTRKAAEQPAASSAPVVIVPNSSPTLNEAGAAVALQQLEQSAGTIAADSQAEEKLLTYSPVTICDVFRHCLANPADLIRAGDLLTTSDLEALANCFVDMTAERMAQESAAAIVTADSLTYPKAT